MPGAKAEPYYTKYNITVIFLDVFGRLVYHDLRSVFLLYFFFIPFLSSLWDRHKRRGRNSKTSLSVVYGSGESRDSSRWSSRVRRPSPPATFVDSHGVFLPVSELPPPVSKPHRRPFLLCQYLKKGLRDPAHVQILRGMWTWTRNVGTWYQVPGNIYFVFVKRNDSKIDRAHTNFNRRIDLAFDLVRIRLFRDDFRSGTPSGHLREKLSISNIEIGSTKREL